MANIPSVPSFADFWTAEDAQAYFAVTDEQPDHDLDRAALDVWRKERYVPASNKLADALFQHLLFLADQGRLGRMENTDGTDVPWVTQWNRLVDPSPLARRDRLDVWDMGLVTMASRELSMLRHSNHDPLQAREKLVSVLQAGHFRWSQIEIPRCRSTGERFFVEINDWKPTLGQIKDRPGQTYQCDFVPLDPGQFSAPGVEHVTIPAPSGELLINDWFRIDAFTQACKAVTQASGSPSVNSIAGRASQSRVYAKDLGFASVSVGNSCPHVFQRNGLLAIGRAHDPDPDEGPEAIPAGTDLGSVCTDLWWTTIIDRQILTDIIARTMPRAEAMQQVADFIAEYSHTVMTARVVPGIHHLYFSGDPDVFKKTFASQELALDDFDEPMCVLSATPLTLKAKEAFVQKRNSPVP